LVTGASEGTGRAVAQALLSVGAKVVLVSRSETRLSQALAQMANAVNGWPAVADVTQAEQVDQMVGKVVEKYGRIDLLVNNVGQGLKRTLVETSDADWQYLVQVNLTSTFLCCRAVVPIMRRQGEGVIINMASKAGRIGEGDFVAYCAVKHGVVGLTRALAESEKPYRIRVNAVCPGPSATEKMIARYPAADRSQWSTPEEVAQAVLYLASPASHAMQGKTLDLF
jgi:NAD(P)-dependent dehydrogenase (short-subunit alcohol dehydrogenase family)